MTINYGKREPGGLTAASPGDTLYIPFASYNDSGNSEALTGLATSDIEIFKNGGAVSRATDSGYDLISDTGQYGDRAGIYRFSVALFNTTDDTGFFDEGSQYHVAVDAVTIDGKTVRFFPGVFEIGRQAVNVTQINSDTGAAAHLQQAVNVSGVVEIRDTGIYALIADLDTGLRDHVDNTDTGLRAYIDNVDTGLHDDFLTLDTGLRSQLIQRTTDTGLRDYINDVDTGLHSRLDDLDTGGGNILKINGDTGAADQLQKAFASGFTDTGVNDRLARILADTDTGLRAQIADLDTGLHDHINDIDTGLRDYINDTDTGLRAHIDDLDTGVKSRFDALAEDTGGVNITAIFGDTGAAAHLQQAVNVSGAIEIRDTGIYGLIADIDTGIRDHILDVAEWVDTGVTDALDALDTGLRDYMNDVDTGLRAYIDNTDTGLRAFIDDIDTGLKSHIDHADTGLRAFVDDIDTGLRGHIDHTDTGLRGAMDNLDTGIHQTIAASDTGISAIKAKTDSLTFTKTGEVDANVQSVNDVTVGGTGTSGDEWGP